jgi:hypothetical protein
MKRNNWMLFAVLVAGAFAGTALRGNIRPTPPTSPQVPPVPDAIRVMEVRPVEVFAGDFATAYGFHMDAVHVKQLWLVDDKASFRLDIMEQTEHSILFRLPAWVPPGRWQIAVLTDHEMLIEQGVYLRVRSYRDIPTG